MNQIKKNITYVLIVSIIALGFSCKKDSSTSNNSSSTTSVTGVTVTKNSLSMTISNPSEGQVINNKTNLRIQGVAKDVNGMHECAIVITTLTKGDTLYQQYPMVHDVTDYTIDFSYLNAQSITTNAVVSLTFSNHNSDVITKSFNVVLKGK